MKKNCPHCQKEFETNYRTKFCPKCRIVDLNCDTCKKPFQMERVRYERCDVPSAKAGKRKAYCTPECNMKAMIAAASKARENFVMVECPNCGKSNRRTKYHASRIFCDRKCYKNYRRNHPEKYPPPTVRNPECIKKIVETRKRNGTNVFAKRGPEHPNWRGGKIHYRGPSWEAQRQIAIEHDLVCVSCGNPGEQVHHIVPFRKFKYKPEKNRNDLYANDPIVLVYLCNPCHGRAKKKNAGVPQDRIDKAWNYYKLIKDQL